MATWEPTLPSATVLHCCWLCSASLPHLLVSPQSTCSTPSRRLCGSNTVSSPSEHSKPRASPPSLFLTLRIPKSLFPRSNTNAWLPCWLSGKEFCCQCRRHGFNPWVGKILWRREWQPTPVFLPGESHEQRSLVGYSPKGHKETRLNDGIHMCVCINAHIYNFDIYL